MRLSFHGAAQTVTGSQHLIEVNGTRILLDCGLYHGKRKEANERNRNLPFEPASIDVLVLSHAHIDHSGNIPNLVKQDFNGDIVCTPATRDLCAAMLRDSGHIHEKDAEYLNKKRLKKGEPPIDPLYTEQDAISCLKHFVSVGYERPYKLTPDITLTLYDAGHMLGSAIVVLDTQDGRLVFSGDIGQVGTPILRDPTLIDEADVLIMESTYGGRLHPSVTDTERDFKQVIERTFARGGKIIIPAFAVGRTQQIVYALNNLYHAHDLPDLTVYVDSPLAVDVTEVFRLHPEGYDEEALAALSHDPDGDIFGFSRLRYVRQVEQSKALNELDESIMIISASGMAETGRILHHLKNNIEDPRNTILIVGWQAPDTLGRRLVEHVSPVRIFGEEYKLRAEVVVLNGFSGHADHEGLMRWAAAFKRPPRHTFLVHGELQAANKLAADLQEDLHFRRVTIPSLHQSFEL